MGKLLKFMRKHTEFAMTKVNIQKTNCMLTYQKLSNKLKRRKILFTVVMKFITKNKSRKNLQEFYEKQSLLI